MEMVSVCRQTIDKTARRLPHGRVPWMMFVIHLEPRCCELCNMVTEDVGGDMNWQEQGKEGRNNHENRTCSEVVTRRKSHRFQLAVRNKFYPQISAATPDIGWAVLATVASEHWGEAKRSIPDLDVVKFTFPRGLDWISLLEVQIDALPWGGWKTQCK